jgi:uncharacterized membrane protein YkoI
MLHQVSIRTIWLTLLIALGLTLLPAAHVEAKKDKQQRTAQSSQQQSSKQQARTLTASQAAASARSQYGGKVLKVTPSGNGYRVKILTEDGRVRTVTIKG